MADTTLGVVAGVWGVGMALSPVLQIRKIRRRRSSADVSVGYLLIVTIGFSLWVAYGAAIRNPVLVVPNAIALVVGVTTIAVALRYRSPGPARDVGRGWSSRIERHD
jgi:uncharacterized protein with PQ loop repeat